MKTINIAIDGPAGAGKSTIAKLLAKELGYIYLDTGAMYRAIALKAYKLGVNPNDEKIVEKFLPKTMVEIKHSNDGEQLVFLDGDNVSKEIRENVISNLASDISRIHAVRLKLVDLQREISQKNNVVVDGRDIGSYVLPNAEYKFYLTASSEVRAKRRYDELIQKGQNVNFVDVLNEVNQRDYNDMNRDFAPLVKAKGSVEIDSSSMDIQEVVKYILREVKR